MSKKPKTLQQLTTLYEDLEEQVHLLRGGLLETRGFLEAATGDIYTVKRKIQGLGWSETGEIGEVEEDEDSQVIDPRKLQKRKKKYQQMRGRLYR